MVNIVRTIIVAMIRDDVFVKETAKGILNGIAVMTTANAVWCVTVGYVIVHDLVVVI